MSNQTVLETKLTADASGILSTLKKVEQETKTFCNDIQSVITYLNQLNNIDFTKLAKNLQKVSVNNITTNISASANQGVVKGSKGDLNIYDVNDPRAANDAHRLELAILREKKVQLEAEKQKTEYIKKEVANYESNLRIKDSNATAGLISARGYYNDVINRMGRRDAQNTYDFARADRIKAQIPYWEYRSAHPERFGPNRFDTKYQMGSALMQIGSSVSGLGAIGKVASGALNVAGSFLKSPAMGLATALTEAAKGASKFTSEAVKAYSELQSIKTNLSVVYGSDTQANAAFQDISQYAVKSPFGVQQTSELAILLKQSGVYASDLMDTLKMLGDTAGGNMEKMKRIANNYAQIVSIGKASMLDMRQFAYAGIPIFEAVSKELGVSQQQLRKLISDGKVTSDIIEKVFKDLTGINGIFENATQKGAETLKARLQNLQDAKQLAMGAIGEGIVNIGSVYGNDSTALNALGFTEQVYQGLNKWASGKNIEKSVTNIDNRDRRINDLQNLIQYAESRGDTAGAAALKKELADFMKMVDPEKDRAVLASAYDQGAKAWEDALRDIGIDKLNEYISKVDSYESDMMKAIENVLPNGYSADELTMATASRIMGEIIPDQTLDKAAGTLQSLQAVINDEYELGLSYKQMLMDYNSIEKEKLLAASERDTINARNTFVDNVSKNSDKTGSVFNNVSEIRQLLESSAESQERERKNQITRLENTQKLLKEISTKMNKGYIDFSQVNSDQLIKWISEGAVAAEKLSTNTDNPKLASESRDIISYQYRTRYGDVNKRINSLLEENNLNPEDAAALRNAWNGLVQSEDRNGSILSDKEFFNTYNLKMKTIIDILNRVSKDNEKTFGPLSDTIQSIGSRFTADTDKDILNANINSLYAKTQNQPLWKRILSNSTGLSASTITGTKSALSTYRDDLAVRNTAGGVFSALLKNGGATSDIQKLIKVSGRTNINADDEGKVFQVDWKATGKSVKEFANQLSASTKVIEAYTSGLETQLDVYTSLLSSGMWQGEFSEGNNKSRTVSTKKLQSYMSSYDQQLINAFGEDLSANGRVVKWKNDKFVYADNNEEVAAEELQLGGKIFDFLRNEIPEIRKELSNANKRELINKVYGNLVNPVANSSLLTAMLKSGSGRNFSLLSEENQQLYLEALKKELNYSGNGGYGSTEDLLAAYVQGNEKASASIDSAINSLLNADSELNRFSELLRYNSYELEKQENARKMANEILAKEFKPVSADSKYEYLAKNELTTLGYGDIGSFSNLSNALSSQTRHDEFNRKVGAIWKATSKGSLNNSEDLITVMENLGFEDGVIEQIESVNGGLAEQIELLNKLAESYGLVSESEAKHIIAQEIISDTGKELKNNFVEIAKQTGKDLFLQPFKQIGEYTLGTLMNVREWSDYLDDAGKGLKQIAAQMLSNMGAEMATAGFRIASAAALEQNWGVVAGGLALAGAGGFAAGMGSVLTESESQQDKTQAEIEKLENIKSDLADILEQARTDAMYYEKNLRHKTALGANSKFSYQSVNDAIIAPGGKVISTAPDDYLIATKTPQNFGNSAPNISFNVINNAGVTVKQQRSVGPDGSVSITAIIEEAVGNFIASDKSDDAFNARQARINGSRFVM